MTAIRGYVAPTTETDALGVHSLDQFVLAVPDASVAQDFYGNFGLDVRRDGNVLAIKTFGHEHRWGSVVEGATTKALHHLSFGCYADDLPRLKARIEEQGVQADRSAARFRKQRLLVPQSRGRADRGEGRAESVARQESRKASGFPCQAVVAGASIREKAPPVRPRRLSHVLIFTRDVSKRSNSMSARLACGFLTAPPTSSPSCTASTAVITIFWRS